MIYERTNPFAPFALRKPIEPQRAAPSAPPSMPGVVSDPKAAAAAIVRAGKIARGEITESTLPPKDSAAYAILAAAAKARGEKVK